MRGNVQTRLAKLARGEADATLLAAAGLDRLGLGEVGAIVDGMLPAPAQGAVGLEVRSDRAEIAALVEAVDDRATSACVQAERAFLAAIGGDCRSAVAAQAEWVDGRVRLRAEILSPDGDEVRAGEGDDPAELALALLALASPALRAMFAG